MAASYRNHLTDLGSVAEDAVQAIDPARSSILKQPKARLFLNLGQGKRIEKGVISA
ncbi:MAG TPA: hypothetical protein VE999_19185 [Gemmataceae bacterium]|nr:hypothetical protein [Gemmataceae bacterium]